MFAKLNALVLNLSVTLCSVILALVLLEGVSRLVFEPIDFLMPRMEEDAYLGHRVIPSTGGHDDWGFRNLDRPNSAEIVAIGDSMTYGIMAKVTESWPSQLARTSGKGVYNMALGGYGPLHYMHLLRTKAILLNPSHVVIGFYFGNDFMDTYNRAYSGEKWASYRLGVNPSEVQQNVFLPKDEPAKFLGSLRTGLARRSVLYRILTQSTLFDFWRASEAKKRAKLSENGTFRHDFPTYSTFLDPARLLRIMNAEDPRIVGATKITKVAFGNIKAFAQENGVALTILLIPTKEFVLFNQVRDRLEPEHRQLLLSSSIAC